MALSRQVCQLTAAGAAVLLCLMGALDLVAQSQQNRTISLRNIHTDDVVTVEYKKNGRFVPEAMERVSWVMRDWRRNETTRMDPALVDLLWEMHTELGSRQPINIISAFRSRATNNMLRASVGGQASESRHILGKAADVQFPDVPLKQMRYSAMIRERGGVGYYPTSGTPFIHVDTDRVRAWPRLPRFELALLFPNGRTQHAPADGGPITSDDVRTAQSRHKDVALQLAAFHDMRRSIRKPAVIVADAGRPSPPARESVVVAALTPVPVPIPVPGFARAPVQQPVQTPVVAVPVPQLVTEPRVVDRPARLSPRPSDDDRRKLTQLVALASIPQLVAEPMLAQRTKPVEKDVAAPLASSAVAALTPAKPSAIPDPAEQPEDAVDANPRLAFVSNLAFDSMTGWSNGFASAPAWDADHPDEEAYRPFPLAAFLTTSLSANDKNQAHLVHPDFARTGELLDGATAVPQMRLRPGRQIAQLVWSQEFGGSGPSLARVGAQAQNEAGRSLAGRRVQTDAMSMVPARKP